MTETNKHFKDLYSLNYKHGLDILLFNSDLNIYKNRFHLEALKKLIPSNSDEFNTQCAQKNILLFGDFHASLDHQKKFYELVRTMNSYRKLVLIFELSQDILNALMEGRNPPVKQQWPFPVKYYKLMLDFAQQHNIPVLSMDVAFNMKLTSRDEQMAHMVQSIADQYPSHLLMVLVGEFHLVTEHLPKYLRVKPHSLVRIFYNPDFIVHKDSFSIKKNTQDTFIICDANPWTKWFDLMLKYTTVDDIHEILFFFIKSANNIFCNLDKQSITAFKTQYSPQKHKIMTILPMETECFIILHNKKVASFLTAAAAFLFHMAEKNRIELKENKDDFINNIISLYG